MLVQLKKHLEVVAVLIDTWWNVNVSSIKKALGSGSRFNRYMVECEYITKSRRKDRFYVLIDTWWNVNFFYFNITFFHF